MPEIGIQVKYKYESFKKEYRSRTCNQTFSAFLILKSKTKQKTKKRKTKKQNKTNLKSINVENAVSKMCRVDDKNVVIH